MNIQEFHPELRKLSFPYLVSRSSWWNIFYPAKERIHWFGDVRLRCTDALYQDVLDKVPCPTCPDDNGNGRICALKGKELDEYRKEVEAWLGRDLYD